MSNPAPDFDVEKWRRWYAASLGVAGASALIVVMLIQIFIQEEIRPTDEPWWEIFAIIFGVWFLFFVLKYVAAYALWYRPYASRRRAIALSLCAILGVYLSMFGGGILFGAFRGMTFNFLRSAKGFWEFHVMIYGFPYLAAMLVGWRFARPTPDIRKAF